MKLTSQFYPPEMACPGAAGSGSLAPVGFPLVGLRASLSSHHAPSLLPHHSLPLASVFPQNCGSRKTWYDAKHYFVMQRNSESLMSVLVLSSKLWWRKIKVTFAWKAEHQCSSPSLIPSFSFLTVYSLHVSCACDVCAFHQIHFQIQLKRTTETTSHGSWGMSWQNGRFVSSCLQVLK